MNTNWWLVAVIVDLALSFVVAPTKMGKVRTGSDMAWSCFEILVVIGLVIMAVRHG